MAVARAQEFSETDAAIKKRQSEDAPKPSKTKMMLAEFIGGLGSG